MAAIEDGYLFGTCEVDPFDRGSELDPKREEAAWEFNPEEVV
jgi:hypothetical protein